MELKVIVAISFVFITGCEQPLTQKRVCQETPGLCADLNKDHRCKKDRNEIILARYREYKTPNDENKYDLLKKFEDYNECVYLATHIEHIKYKHNTTTRVKGHLTALKEIHRLYSETKNAEHPGLLYYHWSRNNDNDALRKLLKMENDPVITTDPEMQFFLASYYAKFDDEKTISLLYKVLELNKPGTMPNLEVFATLTSIFYKQKKFKHAYTFAKVSEMAGFVNIDLIPVTHEITSQGKSLRPLNELASKTFDSIKSGEFVSPRSF
jgi:hypothetical protein